MSIEAMKQALDALEKISMGGSPEWANDVIPALRQAIAQAEKQEPDAWLSGEGLELKQVFVKQNGDWTELPFSIGRPRKEWVKLTELEIAHALEKANLPAIFSYRAAARAGIEAFKEKNT